MQLIIAELWDSVDDAPVFRAFGETEDEALAALDEGMTRVGHPVSARQEMLKDVRLIPIKSGAAYLGEEWHILDGLGPHSLPLEWIKVAAKEANALPETETGARVREISQEINNAAKEAAFLKIGERIKNAIPLEIAETLGARELVCIGDHVCRFLASDTWQDVLEQRGLAADPESQLAEVILQIADSAPEIARREDYQKAKQGTQK